MDFQNCSIHTLYRALPLSSIEIRMSWLSRYLSPKNAGILRSLVRIYDLRFIMCFDSFLQYIFTPLRTHRVTDPPADDLAGVYINDGCQIHKPSFHRHIRNVGTPYLVCMGDRKTPEQIRPDELFQSLFGPILPAVDRLPTHQLQQPADALRTYM